MSYLYPTNLNSGYTNYYPYKQSHNKSLKTYKMKLYGKGSIKVTPDISIVTLGVETENKELTTAQNENSIKMKKVIRALKDNGVEKEDIKTTSFSIRPEYDFVEGRKIFRGYRVNNTLSITIRDIKETGRIIEASLEAGVNNVSDIKFAISKPDQYYKIALNRAIKDSIEKAESIEATLNIILSKTPIGIDEERIDYEPIQRTYVASTSSEAPIMEGTMEISAAVEAVFAYKMHSTN